MLVALIGESGVGKSTLLDALAASASARGRWVLRGGALDNGAKKPLAAFADMAQIFADMYRGHPRLREGLAAVGVVAQPRDPWLAMPAAARSARAVPPARSVASRTTSPYDLLRAICEAQGPGLVLIDDCHLADATSLQLLGTLAADLATSSDSRLPPLVCSFETSELDQARLWPSSTFERFHVPPLDPPAVMELLRVRGAQPEAELVEYVQEHSGGNPFEIQTIMSALFEAGLIAVSSNRLQFTSGANSSLPPFPRSHRPQGWVADHSRPEVFVSERLKRLAPETLAVLQQAAVFGSYFKASHLAAALARQPDSVEQALKSGCARELLADIDGRGITYRFTHERLRAALLGSISAEELQQCHDRVATSAMAAQTPDAFRISHHLRRAGRFGLAVPFALDAAEIALDLGSLDIAQEHYTTAAAGLDEGTSEAAVRQRVHEGLGVVYMLRGTYVAAERHLTEAHREATALEDLAVARVSIALEELAFKSGRLMDTSRWRAEAVAALGVRLPREGRSMRWPVARELVMMLVSFISRRPSRSVERRRRLSLTARLHNRLGYTWFFTSSRTWPLWSMLRARRFALKAGDRAEFAQAESSMAAFIAVFLPRARRLAVALARRAVDLRKAPGDAWGHAQSMHFLGLTLNAAGAYEEAIAAFTDAWDAFEAVGDRWEANAAQWQRALCLFRLGRLREAADLAQATFEAASAIGDEISAGSALAVWTRCRPTDVTAQMLDEQLQRSFDVHTRVMLMSAQGWLLIHHAEYEQASSVLADVQTLARKQRVSGVFVAPLEVWLLHALRCRLAETPDWQLQPRRELERALGRQLWRCLRYSLGHPTQRPEILRALAQWFMLRRHHRRATMVLWRARLHAIRNGALGEVTVCTYVMRHLNEGRFPASPVTEGSQQHADELFVERGFVELVPPVTLVDDSSIYLDRAAPDLYAASLHLIACQSTAELSSELTRLTSHLLPEIPHVLRRITHDDERESAEESPRPSSADSTSEAQGAEIRVCVAAAGIPYFEQVLWSSRSQEDAVRHTVTALARLASAVLTRIQADVARREQLVAVQETERGRVAKDLHDEFGSKFSAIIADASALAPKMSSLEDRSVAEDILAIAREGVLSIRETAWGLRPVGLADLGLIRCLEQLVDNFRRRNRIEAQFMSSGFEQHAPLSPQVQIALYRVIQEALTNIGRRSNARSASVFLNCTDHRLRAIVEDDGRGFVVDDFASSIGLVGMRERLQIVNGIVSIDSQLGRGTTVLAEIPTAR